MPRRDDAPPYAHPQAQRRTLLLGRTIAYAFTRARRRSIGMVVGAEGLSVRAPRWVSLREVDAALQERAAWILRHLDTHHEQALRAGDSQAAWRDGGSFRYLGRRVTIVIEGHGHGLGGEATGRGRHAPAGALEDPLAGALEDPPDAALKDPPDAALEAPPDAALDGALDGAVLRIVGLAPDCAPAAVRERVHGWLQAQAEALFAQRCAIYAPQLGVAVTRLALSAARTRWGSAGIDGSVRLNWRLVHYPLACIDYVVVHELAHLRHMNHGAAFWRLVESIVPDHREQRRLLRETMHD